MAPFRPSLVNRPWRRRLKAMRSKNRPAWKHALRSRGLRRCGGSCRLHHGTAVRPHLELACRLAGRAAIRAAARPIRRGSSWGHRSRVRRCRWYRHGSSYLSQAKHSCLGGRSRCRAHQGDLAGSRVRHQQYHHRYPSASVAATLYVTVLDRFWGFATGLIYAQ